MRNDPRVIYPGTTFYGGLTAPFGASAGMGFNTSPGMQQPMPQPTGLQHAPVSGGLNPAPLSSLFGQAMKPQGPGSTMIK